MSGSLANQTGVENRYRYNGKELHTELNLGWYDYGARLYDPAIGRFTGVDPIAEKFTRVTTYNYAENEPVGSIDLWGLQRVMVNGIQRNTEPSYLSRKSKEIASAVLNPIAALAVGSYKIDGTNINSVSNRIAENISNAAGLKEDNFAQASNAIRHTLGIAITSSRFGSETATRLFNAHEGIGPSDNVSVDMDGPQMGNKGIADQAADLRNNNIGLDIASSLESPASPLDLARMVLNRYKSEGLWHVKETENGWTIEQKILEGNSEEAEKEIERMDENGMTEEDFRQILDFRTRKLINAMK